MRFKSFCNFSLDFDHVDKTSSSKIKSFSLKFKYTISNSNFKKKFYLDSIFNKKTFWHFFDIFLTFFFGCNLILYSYSLFFRSIQKVVNFNVQKKLGNDFVFLDVNFSVNFLKNLVETHVTVGE